MNLRPLLLSSVLWMPLLQGACSDPAPEAYPTYQECFDDHTEVEKLPVMEAIVVCCIDHPIAGTKPACGLTKPDCINYLTANLDQTSASTVEVMDSCAEYITQMKNPPTE